MLRGNSRAIVKSNSKIKFSFADFNGNIEITLKENLDNRFVHRFQDVDELGEIITKISDNDVHIQNPESGYLGVYLKTLFTLIVATIVFVCRYFALSNSGHVLDFSVGSFTKLLITCFPT